MACRGWRFAGCVEHPVVKRLPIQGAVILYTDDAGVRMKRRSRRWFNVLDDAVKIPLQRCANRLVVFVRRNHISHCEVQQHSAATSRQNHRRNAIFEPGILHRSIHRPDPAQNTTNADSFTRPSITRRHSKVEGFRACQTRRYDSYDVLCAA